MKSLFIILAFAFTSANILAQQAGSLSRLYIDPRIQNLGQLLESEGPLVHLPNRVIPLNIVSHHLDQVLSLKSSIKKIYSVSWQTVSLWNGKANQACTQTQ